MKDIKFRFWDRFDKKMYNVRTLGTDGATYNVCSVARSDNHNEIDNCFAVRSIANGKLMQYTGIKDKNGTEIYEGDTVKYIPTGIGHIQVIGNVEYRESYGGWVTVPYEKKNIFGLLPLATLIHTEVIGNIFEQKHKHPITSIFK